MPDFRDFSFQKQKDFGDSTADIMIWGSSLKSGTPSVLRRLSEICQNLNVSIYFFYLDRFKFSQILNNFHAMEEVETIRVPHA
jgi:hypothetical protein